MNNMRNILTQVRNWWSSHRNNVYDTFDTIADWFDRVSRNITRLIMIGLIINIVASHLYPDLPERFPIIYGWFDGWLQFGEFALRGGLGAIYSFFTGNFGEFFANYQAEFMELWAQFLEWLSQISL